MSHLTLKLVRDLLASRWQFLSITFVTALGVAMYHGPMVSYETQKASYKLSYDRLLFADVWIPVRRAPYAAVQRVRSIPGVVAAEGRISEFVEVEQIPPRRRRVIVRLLSVPGSRHPSVNRLRVLAGREPLGPAGRELWLESAFARANNYNPGDPIFPRFGGRRVAFRVAGIVTSPEFIYPVVGSVFALPMPELFGVAFAPEPAIASMIGFAGQVNEIMLRAEPGREQRIAAQAKHVLKAYGPEEPVLRAEQPSNKLLQSDLEGNRPFLIVMPALFLGSATLAVGIMLARWVQAQRGIVGFLRASGFPARAVLLHYLGAGAIIGVAGGLVGLVLGHFLGLWFGQSYERVIRTPFSAPQNRPDIAVSACALALASCILGAWFPARTAARIAPAEAMRGLLPSEPRALARIRLPLQLAMAVRNLLRRPMRTLGTASGVASAVSLMIIAGTFHDSLASALAEAMDDFRRYDITVAFVPERSASMVRTIRNWPGVLRAEETLDIPVRARRGTLEKDTIIMGYARESRLRVLRDIRGRPVSVQPGLVYYGSYMAKRLGAESGDFVQLDYPQNVHGRSATAYVRSGTHLRLTLPLPIYMELNDLRRLFARRLWMPPDAVGGAVMTVKPEYVTIVLDRLNRTEGVGVAMTQKDVTRQVDEVTAFANTFIVLMYLLGAAMAFAVVYTVTDVVLWERTRELATLRTLGFGMGDVLRLVTVENVLLGVTGALLAVYPAYLMAKFLMEAANTEGFAMLLVTSPTTYAFSVAGALLAVLAAQWPGLRRIRRLDLAEAIRLRE